jgi:hypothetical protein
MASSVAILPKGKKINMRRVIENTLTAQARAIKVDLALPQQTWRHKAPATIAKTGPYERTITVDDPIYVMLNDGTRAHDIKPKRPGGVLRFQGPFRPKTVPNEIRSNKGSVGGVVSWSRGVHHPGTKARNWDRVIAKKWRERLGGIFQRAIDSEVT